MNRREIDSSSASHRAKRVGDRHAAVVLMYHRVCQLASDPWNLAVTPARFAEQMDVLRREFTPMTLASLANALERDSVPERAVAVTLDDGYSDVLHEAVPILERFDVPATAFLVSGNLGSGGEFWWDELEGLLLRPGTIGPALAVRIGDAEIRFDLDDDADYSIEDCERDSGWTAWGAPDPTKRHTAFRTLWTRIQVLPGEQIRAAIESVRAAVASAPLARSEYRTVTPDEVAVLGRSRLVDIGAHSTSHTPLAVLDADAQRREIGQCKSDLEEIAGYRITSFAYPYGKRSDYTGETVELVRDAGFERACSNFPGVACVGTDRFQLPRRHVCDWPGDVFAREVADMFGHGDEAVGR